MWICTRRGPPRPPRRTSCRTRRRGFPPRALAGAACAAALVLDGCAGEREADSGGATGRADGDAPVASIPPGAITRQAEALKREEIDAAERLVRAFPHEAEPLALLGMVHSGHGHYDEAAACWERCLERTPDRADVYTGLGRIALLRGEDGRAADLLRKAVATGGAPGDALPLLARALMNLDRAEEAIATLEADSRGLARDPERLVPLGQARLQRRDHEGARACFEAALRERPGDAAACYGLATAYARLGRHDEASRMRSRFERLKADALEARIAGDAETDDEARIRRTVAETLARAGGIYRGHEQARPAEAHFRRAAELDPENVIARMELVMLYRAEERIEEAVEVCERLAELQPESAAVFLQLASLHARQRRVDAAAVALARASELDPDNEDLRRQLRSLEGKGSRPAGGAAPRANRAPSGAGRGAERSEGEDVEVHGERAKAFAADLGDRSRRDAAGCRRGEDRSPPGCPRARDEGFVVAVGAREMERLGAPQRRHLRREPE
jgi:tetratricopeptide (TPR) repeat protein